MTSVKPRRGRCLLPVSAGVNSALARGGGGGGGGLHTRWRQYRLTLEVTLEKKTF